MKGRGNPVGPMLVPGPACCAGGRHSNLPGSGLLGARITMLCLCLWTWGETRFEAL